MAMLDHDPLLGRLRALQLELRDALRRHMAAQHADVWSRSVRDDAGDTVFALDAAVEEILLRRCEEWGRTQHFTLLAEGLDPRGLSFGRPGLGGPAFRLLVDPIDGTRGLMFDKRSAWCLAGAAPDRGDATRLQDVEVAVMVELPTTRQATSDVLWCVRGCGTRGERHDLRDGAVHPLAIVPSGAATLRHGFATVCSYFPGGKALLAQLEEAILARCLRWDPAKAEIYTDQYISTGGQLAELALGRDRFVLDVRPLAHRALGITSSLTCRPYDLAAWLVAQEAGCVVLDPFGGPLDAPLDTTTSVAFAAYANAQLAGTLAPIVREEVHRHLG